MGTDPARPARAGRLAGFAGRSALVVFGVVAGLLLLEVGLQVGAVVVRHTARHAPGAWATGNRRVVTIGDSNTYGLKVERNEAYPKVLERLWNAAPGGPSIEVLNLGYPGTNSAAAREILHHTIATLHPALVTVMVGANDWWTESRPVDALDWRIAASSWLWTHSRVYRLVFMLRRAGQAAQVELTDEWGSDLTGGGANLRIGDQSVAVGFRARDWSKFDGRGWGPVADNLAGIADDCRRAGIPLVFLTYPGNDGIYNGASQILTRIARERHVPLIDVAAGVHPDCPQGVCDLLQPDQHPTARGHARTAEIVRDGLLASGLLGGASPTP